MPPLYPSKTLISLLSTKMIQKNGFSIIELITVIAGIAILTSIAATTFKNIFSDLENDEAQAHLNSLAAECLEIQSRLTNSEEEMGSPSSAKPDLLEKNNYEVDDKFSNCSYFQINPIDSSSESHFPMGFGIFNNKATKFGIAGSNEKVVSSCRNWAGSKNCVDSQGKSFNKFFRHMDLVRQNRASCIADLNSYIEDTPNPSNGGPTKAWDIEKTTGCSSKQPKPNNETSYRSSDCRAVGCTMDAYIAGGKIVAYSEEDYDEFENNLPSACEESIVKHIKNDHEGAPEEIPSLEGCSDPIYFCEYAQVSESKYNKCSIEYARAQCDIDLEEIRKSKSGGPHQISGAGLPPCGQNVWVCKNVIYDTDDKYKAACPL